MQGFDRLIRLRDFYPPVSENFAQLENQVEIDGKPALQLNKRDARAAKVFFEPPAAESNERHFQPVPARIAANVQRLHFRAAAA